MGSERKFEFYLSWLKGSDDRIRLRRLSYVRNNLTELEECDGLVLTGGHDVEPGLYGGSPHPLITETDARRDEFERAAFARSGELGLPVLAICRGLQLVNVHLGGTLIQDIEEAGYPSHRGKEYEQRHDIGILPGTILSSCAPSAVMNVNSSHHQSVKDIAPALKAVATSSDGIVEALEYIASDRSTFLLCVQWHPERIPDEFMSRQIRGSFLKAVSADMNALASNGGMH